MVVVFRPAGETLIICSVIFVIFGILGLQLFSGKLFFCEALEEEAAAAVEAAQTRAECEAAGANATRWRNQVLLDSAGARLF